MKASLQQEGIRDWFLMQKYSVIKVYVFLTTPFILRVYLNPSLFTPKFIKKKISTDEEHFTAHMKDSWIKYPINFGPFILKNPTTLPIVEKILKDMKFQVTHAHNYNPKGVISQRRVQV